MDISFESLTNQGERQINEDCLGVTIRADAIVFVLCDGLGGHGNGDAASSHVVSMMDHCLNQGLTVEESIMQSQNTLLEKQKAAHQEDSIKTTLTCLVVTGDHAQYVHVGDSRIYLFDKGKYRMRSQDHSVPQMLVNSGAIREEAIRGHEDRSRLLRVMGTEWNTPKYQWGPKIPLTKDATFLLCSDGFWELIDEKTMSKLLKKSDTPQEWLTNMEQEVIRNGRGTNMDNYSAIAVFIR